MRKLSTLLIALVFVSAANAQWFGNDRIKGNGNITSEKRKTATYDKVAVSGFFDVELVSGSEGNLTIKGESNLIKYIITEVKDDVLKIKVKKGYNLRTSFNKIILITVPFKNISGVSLSGSGDVITKDVINADHFSTALSGSGDVNLEISANSTKARVSGSGDVRISGKSGSFECAVSGSGDIHAFNLKTKHADAKVSGSGNIRVNCTESIKGRVSGSGDIEFKGNPDKEDTKVAGSGDIERS